MDFAARRGVIAIVISLAFACSVRAGDDLRSVDVHRATEAMPVRTPPPALCSSTQFARPAAAAPTSADATGRRRDERFGPLGEPPEVFAQDRCIEKRVATSDELESTLRSDFVGCVVLLRDHVYQLTGKSDIPIKSGVTLIGERGELCSRPVVFTNSKDATTILFSITGNNVHVKGVQFVGPAHDDRSKTQPYVTAIQVVADPDQKLGRGIVIEDSAFAQWTGSGVDVISVHRARVPEQYEAGWAKLTRQDAPLITIRYNYFHHNAREDGGYGVSVGKSSYALIEGNVFNYNRHSIASDGFAHTGYIAHFNYDLQGGFMQDDSYNQHYDVHGTNDRNGDDHSSGYGGTAGEYYEIASNTFRGDQDYAYGFKTRSTFMLRGAPTEGAYFNNNVAVHEDLDGAVALKWSKSDTGWGEDEGKFHFHSSGNHFGTDHSDELAAGDFDGDGKADVFVATGTAWFFSPGGVEAWIFLHASNKLTGALGFADIDNDGVTDILYRDDAGKLGYLKSGRAVLVPLTTSPVAMKDLRFGDFDGDGKTDIFCIKDHWWQIWYGSTKAWAQIQHSDYAISGLLFGEFDNVRGTDVAVVTSNMWAYSSAGVHRWEKLNDRLYNSFKQNVVAGDFDGDGKTDIAIDQENQIWLYSKGGRSSLAELRTGDGQTPYPPLKKLLIARFEGAMRDEVLSWYDPYRTTTGGYANYFAIWRGDGGRAQMFEAFSAREMR